MENLKGKFAETISTIRTATINNGQSVGINTDYLNLVGLIDVA